jgi:ribose/xylose/arabinose/galactoside ABC-type transport system permease subunit
VISTTSNALTKLRQEVVGTSTRVMVLLIVLLFILGWQLEGGLFLGSTNLDGIAIAIAVPLFIAVAAAVGLLGGIIDLSVGSNAAFGAATFVVAMNSGMPAMAAALVSIGIGIVIGLINGTVCVIFGAEPLIATIGSLSALRGLTLVILGGNSKPAFLAPLFKFTNATYFGIPVLFTLIVALAVLCALALTFTRFGRHIRATGGDPAAARRAGIGVSRIKMILFIMTSLFATIGGILYVGMDGSAQTTLGTGLELQVYAPILLGGYSLTRGGVGNVMGAVSGVLALAVVSNLLDLLGANPYWSYIVTGAVVIAAVYADGLRGGERFE